MFKDKRERLVGRATEAGCHGKKEEVLFRLSFMSYLKEKKNARGGGKRRKASISGGNHSGPDLLTERKRKKVNKLSTEPTIAESRSSMSAREEGVARTR